LTLQKNDIKSKNGFLSLCYHYIRPNKELDLFSRLLGINIQEFQNHISMLKKNYEILDLNDLLDFFKNKKSTKFQKIGMLLTFDDGLSDHYEAAKILHQNSICGTFFIPTCIIDEKLPANPIIIHYVIAKFGISTFINEFNSIKNNFNLPKGDFELHFSPGDDIWKIISEIKTIFKYTLDYSLSRQILLQIYEKLFLPEFPNAMEIMHLTKDQISDMIQMGHSVGTHSHTHISLHGQNYPKNIFEKEIIYPKNYLESHFGTSVLSMSYPFGQPQDCFSSNDLKLMTNDYELCFTVNDILNSSNTSPLEIGRYLPLSSDTTSILDKKLRSIVSKS